MRTVRQIHNVRIQTAKVSPVAAGVATAFWAATASAHESGGVAGGLLSGLTHHV